MAVPRRPAEPLSRLLFRYFSLGFLLISLLLSGIQLVLQDHDNRRLWFRSTTSLAQTFSPGLVSALWDFQDSLVTSLTDGLKLDPQVAALTLTDPRGKVIVDWRAGADRPPSALLRVETRLVRNEGKAPGRLLAVLVLYGSEADVQKQLLLSMESTLTLLVSLLFFAVMALWGFTRTLVVVPLTAFTRQVDELLRSPSGPLVTGTGGRIAEIRSLEGSFNTLVSAILARQAEIERDNALLERRVDDRTRDLEQAKLAAEAADRAKGQFLANMSHEIRTPMNAILGFTRLVRRTDLDDVQQDYLEKIDRSAQNLMVILNEILDFSKIEAGKLDLHPTPFRLAELLEKTLDLLGLEAERKGLELRWECGPGIPEDLEGDVLRLGQVLTNLVNNAVKFTSAGGVGVFAAVEDQGTWGIRLRFSVVDTGIGLTEDQQSRLFVPFSQADGSITRQFGGTGLGLAICRRLVELMDGTIGVRSTPGEGSCFWFTVRLGAATGPPGVLPADPEVAEIPGRGGRVLLVEDNELNRLLARELLVRAGLEVTVAHHGAEAVDLAGRGEFDLVLMDLHMPVMGGFEATAQLRTRFPNLPIVAMTANAMVGSREECLAAGMDDYLTKPLDFGALYRVLDRWLPQPSAVRTTAVQDGPSGDPGEDTPDIKITEALDRLGGDRNLFGSLVAMFLSGQTVSAARVRTAWETGGVAEAAAACHTLKGVAANLSFPLLYAATLDLELALREGRAADVPGLLEALDAAEVRVKEGAARLFDLSAGTGPSAGVS